MRRLALLLPLVTVCHAASLPVFPPKNVPEVFFGTTVDDPYRPMENEKDPEVAKWMRAHAEYADNTLQGLKGHEALLKRITELDNAASARIGAVQRSGGGVLFFSRRAATDNVFKLYVRGADGAERLLVDPDEWQKETGKPHAMNYFEPSPDGKRVAVGVSPGGNEMAVLYVYDVASGKRVGKPIDRARYSVPNWLPDGSGFFYKRTPQVEPAAPVSASFIDNKTYLHRVGTDADVEDMLVMEPGEHRGVTVRRTDYAYVFTTPGSRWVLMGIVAGVQREVELYATTLQDAVRPDARWTKICGFGDKVTGYAIRGDDIYLRTHAASPRFSIVRTSLAAPSFAKAEVVVAPGTELVNNLGAARDALYFETRDGALKKLKRLPWGARAVQDVTFPIEGAVDIVDAAPDKDGVIAGMAAWTRAREIYEVKRDGKVVNTGLQPLGPFDAPTDLVSVEVKVRSHDGALVPLSIIHKKGIRLDGSNPAMMHGYGSYGITYDAGFDPIRLAFLEKGGVIAVANVRGSSAYGEDWYKAGYKATKPNTWRDFIACAEYLIAQKYTSNTKLAITGGSAGGITVGRALTERPDLFAAVIPVVGMLDFVRLHVMPIGPVNVVEFGDVKTEEGFKSLHAMSAYHHVKEGTKYPAILLQHGVNDTRVNVGQSNKMAARLMASSTSGKPVLLDLDYDSGHGQGMTKLQRQKTTAKSYAFVLWQTGHPEFQPR